MWLSCLRAPAPATPDPTLTLLVVAAYPNAMRWDIRRGDPDERAEVLANIARVPLPDQDPVQGQGGPLVELWSRVDRGVPRPDWTDATVATNATTRRSQPNNSQRRHPAITMTPSSKHLRPLALAIETPLPAPPWPEPEPPAPEPPEPDPTPGPDFTGSTPQNRRRYSGLHRTPSLKGYTTLTDRPGLTRLR